MGADDWLGNYGYSTDYQAQSKMLHLWHATGGDRDGEPNPLYYGDDKPDLKWTDESASGVNIDNMDTIYLRIKGQNATAADQAGTAWYTFALNMWDIVTAIGKNTDQLRDGSGGFTAWKSDAANAFYTRGPGATIKSVRDWQTAAYTNSTAMHDLAGIITRYHIQIDKLHSDYMADINKFEAWWNKTMAGGKWKTSTLNLQPETVRNMYIDRNKMIREGNFDSDIHAQEAAQAAGLSMRNFSAEAKVIQQKMANEYAGPINTLYSEGRSTKDEGPTNAVTVDQDTLKKVFADAFGGGGGPGVTPPPPPNITVPPINLPNLPDVPDPNVDVPVVDPNLQGLDPNALPDPQAIGAPGLDPGLVPGLPPGLNPGLAPGLLPPGLAPGVPGLGGKGVAPSINPPSTSNFLGKGGMGGGGPSTLPGGLLGKGGMPGGSGGMPPGMGGMRPPGRAGDPRNKVNRGVLSNRGGHGPTQGLSEEEQQNLRSGGPPGGMPGSRRPGRLSEQRDTERGGGPHLTNEFGDHEPGAPTSPPVLGRPPARKSERSGGPDQSRLSPDVFASQVYTPPNTTRPVLGAPQHVDEFNGGGGGPGQRNTAPGTPGQPPGGRGGPNRTERDRTGGSTAYPPLPGDAEWLTQLPGDALPPALPVIDGSRRPTDAERAGGAWNDQLPISAGRPGTTAPVIGRAAVPGHGGPGQGGPGRGENRSEHSEHELRTRRRMATPPPAVGPAPETEVPPVVGDEEAFSVYTPGGEVLGTEREKRGYEVEPKPTLGN